MALHLALCWWLQSGDTALIVAAWEGKLAKVQALLAAGADVDLSKKV